MPIRPTLRRPSIGRSLSSVAAEGQLGSLEVATLPMLRIAVATRTYEIASDRHVRGTRGTTSARGGPAIRSDYVFRPRFATRSTIDDAHATVARLIASSWMYVGTGVASR